MDTAKIARQIAAQGFDRYEISDVTLHGYSTITFRYGIVLYDASLTRTGNVKKNTIRIAN